MTDAISGNWRRRASFAAALGFAVLIVVRVVAAAQTSSTDWPTYGHDLHRTFSNQTALTPATAAGLAQAWFFETDDAANQVNGAVSAQPIVVNGSIYVGSWNGKFYGIDA